MAPPTALELAPYAEFNKNDEAFSFYLDTNLFAPNPEGYLFDDDTSSPFGKKGGRFSGGGGLFDEINEENDENQESKV